MQNPLVKSSLNRQVDSSQIRPIDNIQMEAAFRRHQDLQKSMLSTSNVLNKSRNRVRSNIRKVKSDIKKPLSGNKGSPVAVRRGKISGGKEAFSKLAPANKVRTPSLGLSNGGFQDFLPERNDSKIKVKVKKQKTFEGNYSKLYKELQSKPNDLFSKLTETPKNNENKEIPATPKYKKFVKNQGKGRTSEKKRGSQAKSTGNSGKVDSRKNPRKKSLSKSIENKTKKIKSSSINPEAGKGQSQKNKSQLKNNVKSVKSKSHNKSAIKTKKNSKIERLFHKEKAKTVDFDMVCNNWITITIMNQKVFMASELGPVINTYFVQILLKKYSGFIGLFTDFKGIQAQIKELSILEFWTFFALFYFIHEEEEVEPLCIGPLKRIFGVFLKIVFYVGLILSKAQKAGILDFNPSVLRKLNVHMKSFNFPTGVPLIKTIKEGNKTVRKEIKKVLFYTNRKIKKQFEKSLEMDQISYEDLLKQIGRSLVPEFRNLRERKMHLLDSSNYLFEETQEIHRLLSKKKNSTLPEDKSSKTNKKKELNIQKKMLQQINPILFLQKCLHLGPKKNVKKKGNDVEAEEKSLSKSSRSKKNEKRQTKETEIKETGLSLFKRNPSSANPKPVKVESDPRRQLNNSSIKIKRKNIRDSGIDRSSASNLSKANLSDISNKYQPLLNLSELRQSAISLSKKNKESTNRSTLKSSKKKQKSSFRITKFR